MSFSLANYSLIKIWYEEPFKLPPGSLPPIPPNIDIIFKKMLNSEQLYICNEFFKQLKKFCVDNEDKIIIKLKNTYKKYITIYIKWNNITPLVEIFHYINSEQFITLITNYIIMFFNIQYYIKIRLYINKKDTTEVLISIYLQFKQ